MPTFLEMHNLDTPKEVQGKSILKSLTNYSENYSIYGYWGSGINVLQTEIIPFSGTQKMMKELNQYTLMPTNMRSFFCRGIKRRL